MGDVYIAVAETDRGLKEQLRLYDTQGLQEEDDFPKHYYCMADGFILVYAVNSLESFEKVNWLKKEIDKFREKKEVKDCSFYFFQSICTIISICSIKLYELII